MQMRNGLFKGKSFIKLPGKRRVLSLMLLVCDPPDYGPLEYQVWLSRNRAKRRSYCKRAGKQTSAQRMSQIVFLSIVPGVMRVDQRSVHILIHHSGEGFTKSFHPAKTAAGDRIPIQFRSRLCLQKSPVAPYPWNHSLKHPLRHTNPAREIRSGTPAGSVCGPISRAKRRQSACA